LNQVDAYTLVFEQQVTYPKDSDSGAVMTRPCLN